MIGSESVFLVWYIPTMINIVNNIKPKCNSSIICLRNGKYLLHTKTLRYSAVNLHNNIETYIQIYHTSNIQQGLLFSFK